MMTITAPPVYGGCFCEQPSRDESRLYGDGGFYGVWGFGFDYR
jgi:hypothetical protein